MQKEVFRAGTWTDSKGNSRVWTEKDLDSIVASFNENEGKNSLGRRVPLVPGHPETDTPAVGWVTKVWRNGKKLFAEFGNVIEKAQNAIEQMAFRDVSIAISNGVLRHVGLTNFPAVAGMADFKFEDDADFEVWTFSEEPQLSKIENLFKKYFTKPKPETGDEEMSQIEDLKKEIEDLKAAQTEMSQKVTDSEAAAKDFEAKFTAKEKELTELKEAGEQAKLDAIKKSEEEFVDGLIEDGKLYPKDKEFTLKELEVLRDSGESEFTIGEDKKKMSHYEYKKLRLKESPKLSELESEFTDGKDRSSDIIDVKARELMEKNAELEYNQAVVQVLTLHPELNVEGE